ncbi:hypothetical protein BDD12DRAFT_922343 [Trichophaea hybrida]|nr:hypothetical protein BDD12DRAFT_922343 [Trichophaea hybrida]
MSLVVLCAHSPDTPSIYSYNPSSTSAVSSTMPPTLLLLLTATVATSSHLHLHRRQDSGSGSSGPNPLIIIGVLITLFIFVLLIAVSRYARKRSMKRHPPPMTAPEGGYELQHPREVIVVTVGGGETLPPPPTYQEASTGEGKDAGRVERVSAGERA